jgi:hypothetical protein
VNPLPYEEVHTVLDGVEGKGHYVGTYLAWGVNSSGWWGEEEMEFYLDGEEWPTICGTGLEDYFCASYDFEVEGAYVPFSTPYSGMQLFSPTAATAPKPGLGCTAGTLWTQSGLKEGDSAGAGVAEKRPLPALTGRHCLVSGNAVQPPEALATAGIPGD